MALDWIKHNSTIYWWIKSPVSHEGPGKAWSSGCGNCFHISLVQCCDSLLQISLDSRNLAATDAVSANNLVWERLILKLTLDLAVCTRAWFHNVRKNCFLNLLPLNLMLRLWPSQWSFTRLPTICWSIDFCADGEDKEYMTYMCY